MAPEISNLKEDVKEVRSDVKEIKRDVKEGFSTMNGRVKALELAEAGRQGRESVMSGNKIDWNAIIKLALRALSAAIVLATLLVKILQFLLENGRQP